MSIQFRPGIDKQCWDRDVIMNRLHNIANADKVRHWIRRDLTVVPSSSFNRAMWPIANFVGLRTLCYQVDCKVTKRILIDLSHVAVKDPEMADLFLRAVNNFQGITRYPVSLQPEVRSGLILASQQFNMPRVVPQVVVEQQQPPVVAPQPVIVEEPVVEHRQPVIVDEPVIVHHQPVIVEEPVIIHHHNSTCRVSDPYPVYETRTRPIVVIQDPPMSSFFRRPYIPNPVMPPVYINERTHGRDNAPRMVPGTGMPTHMHAPRPAGTTAEGNVIPGTGLRTPTQPVRQPAMPFRQPQDAPRPQRHVSFAPTPPQTRPAGHPSHPAAGRNTQPGTRK